jgi:hypothetical protein
MSNYIRQSHLMRRSHIILQFAVSHCTRLCLDLVVSCRAIVVTLTWVFFPNFVLNTELFRNGFGKDGSHSARSGRNLARNGNAKFLWIMPVPQHTDQKTQDIETIFIRESRICHDIVTIVIRLRKIGWVSRMLRDAPYCGSAWPTSPDHSRFVELYYEYIRLRSDSDRTFLIIEDSNLAFHVAALSDLKREP